MTSSDMEMRSPVLTSMSYSRGGWVALTALARRIRSSVVLPMALTTATTSVPCRRVRAMWSATARIRSASPTEVPPNFWTTSGIRTRLQTGHRPARRPAPRPPRAAGRSVVPAGRSETAPGLGRVSGRAQRQESPPARGRRGPAGRRGQGQKRRKQIRNGIIIVVIAGGHRRHRLPGLGGQQQRPVQGQHHDDDGRRRTTPTPRCRPRRTRWRSRPGCPASTRPR